MDTENAMNQDDFDSSMAHTGSPLNRLDEVNKQLSIVIGELHEESEHVDPDPVAELEAGRETIRGATETLAAQQRETDTELSGGEGE